MKTSSLSLVGISALAVAVALGWLRISALEDELAELRRGQAEEKEEEFELADAMGGLQRFADKLYFAGQQESWELAAFYLHEIEETAESIAERQLSEGGVALTPLLQTMLAPAVAALEGAVEAKDAGAFREGYPALVSSCNACHQASGHGFVRITVPERSMFENQAFAPLPASEER